MSEIKLSPIEKWVVRPMSEFINKSTTGGILLILATIVAVVLANSPLQESFFSFWKQEIGLSWAGFSLYQSLHHWINDGLMAVFFFVVGLELKREIIGGELSSPRKAILPIVAGIGGMIFPALIYLLFNGGTDAARGWGIPMATDIAFALGILHLLGNKVPTSLKIFLTAFAIVDDIGAVLVIALFYTDHISFTYLFIGLGLVALLFLGNKLGVRNLLFYAIIGIVGIWFCFLMSGVHATIASILVAFTIPANSKVGVKNFSEILKKYVSQFENTASSSPKQVLTNEQLHILHGIEQVTKAAMTPLQKLEHALHPIVTFLIIPIFAIANAGLTINSEMIATINNPVTIGVALGLFFGKMIGIFGLSSLVIKLKITDMPKGISYKHLFGVGIISAIGFTMSLFIADLAFIDQTHMDHAKIAILVMSVFSGITGYTFLHFISKKNKL